MLLFSIETAQMGDQLRSQTRVVASPQHHSPSLGPGYLQQSQYDADLQFQQFISQNLSLLNDDEVSDFIFFFESKLFSSSKSTEEHYQCIRALLTEVSYVV